MPKGIKGFQLGHETSAETRQKIGDALRCQVIFNCDYCGLSGSEKPSHYVRYKRHFCSIACYAAYRSTRMQPHEQNSWRGGVSPYEAHKRWVSNNKERMAHLKARRYARERGAEGTHTFEQWQALKNQFNNLCAHCSEAKPLTKDHIIPLSEDGNDYITNIQPLCRNCNSRKWKHPELLKGGEV